jgi:hypothetical protein
MKNLFFTTILVLGIIAASWAQTANNQQVTKNETEKQAPIRQFTDTNNDGVCDNYSERARDGQGRNFTDINKDGICDNRNTTQGKNLGQGRGKCNGNGRFGYGHRHGKGGNGRGNGNCLRNQDPDPKK